MGIQGTKRVDANAELAYIQATAFENAPLEDNPHFGKDFVRVDAACHITFKLDPEVDAESDIVTVSLGTILVADIGNCSEEVEQYVKEALGDIQEALTDYSYNFAMSDLEQCLITVQV